jgi:hypothetical protein
MERRATLVCVVVCLCVALLAFGEKRGPVVSGQRGKALRSLKVVRARGVKPPEVERLALRLKGVNAEIAAMKPDLAPLSPSLVRADVPENQVDAAWLQLAKERVELATRELELAASDPNSPRYKIADLRLRLATTQFDTQCHMTSLKDISDSNRKAATRLSERLESSMIRLLQEEALLAESVLKKLPDLGVPGKPVLCSAMTSANAPGLWPPPRYSAYGELPRRFFKAPPNEPVHLAGVEQTLVTALGSCGYDRRQYYSVPEGFAMVTRLEQINSDGTSKQPPERWACEVQPLGRFSLVEYLKALFTAPVGRYRLIVFMVTSEEITQQDVLLSQEEALAWLGAGADRLPADIGKMEYTEGHRCAALIYEFEQANPDELTELKWPGYFEASEHLAKAGLWDRLETAP